MEVPHEKLILFVAAGVWRLRFRSASPALPMIHCLQLGSRSHLYAASQTGDLVCRQLSRQVVVLYFYPKDMTTGCTIEAHNFQRDLSKFEAENAVILGVSVDTVDSTSSSAQGRADLPLLAIPSIRLSTIRLARHFGTWTIANRNTFLIDPTERS